MVCDIEETFYFKPEAGKLLGSPADETPMEPCDVQPEELDIAIAADRIQTAAMAMRSEEHTSELQSLMRISDAVFCLKKNSKNDTHSCVIVGLAYTSHNNTTIMTCRFLESKYYPPTT